MPQKTEATTAATQNKSQDANARFGEYLNQVFESPFYKKGDQNIQRSVREKLYEQKMKPFYAKYGLPLPDRNYFVDKGEAQTLKDSQKDKPSAIEEGVTSFATEVAKTGGKVVGALDKAGSYIGKEYFAEGLMDTPQQKEDFKKSWDNAAGVVRNKLADNLTEFGQRGEEWSEDNHVDDLKHSIGKYGGMLTENVAEFEAVLKPLKAAGVAVGSYKYLGGITKVLQNSQRGRLGLHILTNATAAYSIDKIKGEDNKTAAKGAGYMVAGDLVLHGAGKLVKGFMGRVASVGGRPLVEEVIQGMDSKTPPPDKVGTALVKTSTDLRDKIAQEMFGVNYKDIPNIKDKGKVNKAFVEAAAQAPKSKGATNKTAIKIQVSGAIEKHKKASPQFSSLANALEEANPRKTEDVVTSEQVTRDEAKTTGKNATKLAKGTSATIDDLAKSVGSAGIKDPVFLNNLADIARDNVPSDIKKLEGHRNKVAFLWSVRQELPKKVVREVIERMKEFFPETKPKDWDSVAKRLDTHMEQMRASGHVDPKDTRGVFRSTQLVYKPTKWQEQLAIEAEVASLKKKTKRKDVQGMLDSLNRALRKKNPDTEKLGAKLDEIKAKHKALKDKPLKGVNKIRAATPNATGTDAEKAVEKALAKLDTKRTKEQKDILQKTIDKIEREQRKKPKSVGAAALNDSFAFRHLVRAKAPVGNYAAIINAIPAKSLSDLNFNEEFSIHAETLRNLVNADPNFRSIVHGASIYVDGASEAYEAMRKAARFVLTGDEVGVEHFVNNSKNKFVTAPDHVPFFGESVPKTLIIEDVAKKATQLVDSIRQSEPHDKPLFRGIHLHDDAPSKELRNLRVGDVIPLDRISSFSDNFTVAKHFTYSYDGFILELKAGAKALRLAGISGLPEFEFITQGEFEVKEIIQESDGLRRVIIEQKGVY